MFAMVPSARPFLLCVFAAPLAWAVPTAQTTCTTQPTTANFEDIQAPKFDNGNIGLNLTSLGPYRGLDYVRLSALDTTERPGPGNIVFYTLSQLSTQLEYVLWWLLYDLMVPPSEVPFHPPAIYPVAPAAQFDLQGFDFACFLRGFASPVTKEITFSCRLTVTVNQTMPFGSPQVKETCTYKASGTPGKAAPYARCNVNAANLTEARFVTTAILTDEEQSGVVEFLGQVTEVVVITAMDNVTYSLPC